MSNTVKVKATSTVYRDGGTRVYKDKEGNLYYVDKRINSGTKGKVFNKYPGDAGAEILDIKLKIEEEVKNDRIS